LEKECPRVEVLMYLDGELDGEEKEDIENHLKECETCKEHKEFAEALSVIMPTILEPPKEDCPSSLILSLYANECLDKETKRNVDAHILYCDECFKELLVFEKIEEELRSEGRFKEE